MSRHLQPHRTPSRVPRFAFTIIELLVVISIVALLIGILLPAIQKARDTAKVSESLTHLKNMGIAHANYSAEWNDRQYTLVKDDLASYGSAIAHHSAAGEHPPILLGWGYGSGGGYGLYAYWFSSLNTNEGLLWPIKPTARYGWFRIPNAKQFTQYVNGRFYDKTFYAPKDKAVLEAIGPFFDFPGEYVPTVQTGGGGTAYWSSYCLSPAALFAPKVLDAAHPTLSSAMGNMPGGAFRVPSMSQARHPSLKTHMLEHHWLQGNRGLTCNPFFGIDGTYNDCEPYFFNHSFESAPGCLFFDGSVRTMSVRESGSGDWQSRNTNGKGLYFRPTDTEFASAGILHQHGYYLEAGYDFSTEETGTNPNNYATGFHILTKDGILGRDTLGNQ